MFTQAEIKEIRKDFPYLELHTKEKPLIYLDSAATTQKPKSVIEAMNNYYSYANGGPHRGAHRLSMAATEVYEGARQVIADFINAPSADQIVFTRNATESLNLVAYSWALENLKEGDEILISIMEHHANLVTWQYVAEKTGAKLNFMYLDEDKQIPWEEFTLKVNEKVKLFAITQSSNVLGTMPEVKKMIAHVREHAKDAICVIDGCQSTPHKPVDVQDLDADFFVFSGHKMLAAMGSGVLYGKLKLLNKTKPFLYGGDMIEYVYEDHTTFLDAPGRFEAGTQDVGAAASLPAAVEYLNHLGMDKIYEYESYLMDYAYEQMKEMKDIEIYTTPKGPRGAVLTFNFKEVHPHDVASILDSKGIAIRSGHHCAQPLHRKLGMNFSCRASFAIYNTMEEVEYFLKNLDEVRRLMGLGTR
ncbi:SufS family cysteine desulfurase [Peptoniphilus sp. KCTC 25270]|uniref:aminotransferase class V-fold PLP-dependent enzyme n=1 Tax=Peptoniphilus sp. KCTC 25270 TaxID=2897414 RepID=UPI001E511710|nr:SufS family cysteine desulfurase [Peptoniphilus sp. KCTC 25270]MCD1147775.1 SufS family cysteine desulfurase [Peptoniphilus sp. KCTC 25270]